MAGIPTPTQAEANAINAALYAGTTPPPLAPDGSPLDPNSMPGMMAVPSQPLSSAAAEPQRPPTPARPAATPPRAT